MSQCTPASQEGDVTLPLPAVPVGRETQPSPSTLLDSASRRAGTMIWVIDDSPTVRAVMTLWLSRPGLVVRTFAHGYGAIRYARALWREPAPSLILVDVELPRIDGFVLVQRLRALPVLAGARIILMSGRDGTLDRIQGKVAGADAYLIKPVTSQTVYQLVQTTCELATLPGRQELEEAASRGW